MSIITPYINNLEKLKTEIPDIAKTAIMEHKDEILYTIQFGQLGLGKNSFDKPLKWSGGNGYYGKTTQQYADAAGIPYDKTKGQAYNFQWSGDTFDSMGIKQQELDSYEIFTIDGKQRLLEKTYGEIFKLTPQNNKFINDTIIVPAIYQHILKNLLRVKR
jgi:hypothetical protein